MAQENTHLDDSLALMPRRAAEAPLIVWRGVGRYRYLWHDLGALHGWQRVAACGCVCLRAAVCLLWVNVSNLTPPSTLMAAQAYFAIAYEYERCIPAEPANMLCGRRWGWPECRIVQALARLQDPPLQRGELGVAKEFGIIDCNREDVSSPVVGDLRRVVGEGGASASCEEPRRRKYAGLSSMWPPIWCGVGWFKKWCNPYCACTNLSVAHFPKSAYDAQCLRTLHANRTGARTIRAITHRNRSR